MNLPSNLTDIFMTLRYVTKSVVKKLSGTFVIYMRGSKNIISKRSTFWTHFIWILVFEYWFDNWFLKISHINAYKIINITTWERCWINFRQFIVEIYKFLVVWNAKLHINISWSILTNSIVYLKIKSKSLLCKFI